MPLYRDNENQAWLMNVMLCAISILFSSQLLAINRCRTYSNTPVQRICSTGGNLPSTKVRNIHAHALNCGVGVDSKIRHPETYDRSLWQDLLESSDEGVEEAFDYRQSESKVAWKGAVTYDVAETWAWEKCVYKTNGAKCGYHTVCSYDSDGSRSCHSRPNACWYDEVRYEALPCSEETMHYDLEYLKPDEEAWNPSKKDYNDVIPNKYDLLPGEWEDVQVFNLAKAATILTPQVKVSNAWNDYKISLSGSGVNAQCRENTNYEIRAVVETLNRKTNRKTPNAFKLPVHSDGGDLEPIVWESGTNKDGKTILEALPRKVRLTDQAAGMADLLARQSRKNKMDEPEQEESGYWRNTSVKVELFRKNYWLWNDKWGKTIYTRDINSVKASNYALSDDQELMYSDFWEIDLDQGHRDGSIYRHDNWLSRVFKSEHRRHLQPNRNYILRVSMYQEGLPFYRQSCEVQSGWDCYPFVPWPLKRSERKFYSEPLEIHFRTSSSFDDRSWNEKLMDDSNLMERFLFWLNERKKTSSKKD